MSARAPQFGLVAFVCGGCHRMKTFPFLDRKGLVIHDIVRALTPRCRCGSMMEVKDITRVQGCGEEEVAR